MLPWQCHVRCPDVCASALFLDVDYPDLISKKREVILENPELQTILGDFDARNDSPLLLESERYCQIACDLRQLSLLERIISSVVDTSECVFLFVAEVSITYMETAAADALILWASKIGDGKRPASSSYVYRS